jgi:hypothetical protein
MAQRRRARRQPKAQQARQRPRQGSIILGQRNVLLLVAGVVVIALGYILLGRGSITAAPVLLVVGYCIMIPLSIILWVKKPEDKQETGTGE